MYKLVFFCPPDHTEAIKEAVFAAGAGRYNEYDRCAWQMLGAGQFRPSAAASPFIGSADVTERLDEHRVEIVCTDDVVRGAIAALIAAHPYEEPAYEIYRIWQVHDLPEELA